MRDRLMILLGLATCLSGCSGGNGSVRALPAHVVDNAVPVLAAAPDPRVSNAVLDYIADINALDGSARDALLDAAMADYANVRSPANAVTLALALQSAAPTDLDDAALRALLTAKPAVPANLRSVIVQRLALNERAARNARAESARARRIAELEASLEQSSSKADEQLSVLRAELDRAEAKIRALTSIEEEIKRSALDGSAPP